MVLFYGFRVVSLCTMEQKRNENGIRLYPTAISGQVWPGYATVCNFSNVRKDFVVKKNCELWFFFGSFVKLDWLFQTCYFDMLYFNI